MKAQQHLFFGSFYHGPPAFKDIIYCLLFIILLTLSLLVGAPVGRCLCSASPKQIIFKNNKVELN